jgi:hypothetical protein
MTSIDALCNKTSTLRCRLRRLSLRSTHVRFQGNEAACSTRCRCARRACCVLTRVGVGLACERSGAARILRERRRVRGRAASWHRHRARHGSRVPRARIRHGDVRRVDPRERPHGHDRGGRVQGDADASRSVACPSRRGGLGRRRSGGARSDRRAGVRRALCAFGHSGRRRRDVRRPARAPSASWRSPPSHRARGAART